MTHHLQSSRRRIRVAAAGCFAVAALTVSQSPAHAAKPTTHSSAVTVTTTSTYTSAAFTVTVARSATQISSATCSIDGFTIDCGSAFVASRKSTQYFLAVMGLGTGTHRFAIDVRFTGGAHATGSADFEISTATAT